jgi:hypothetical protein
MPQSHELLEKVLHPIASEVAPNDHSTTGLRVAPGSLPSDHQVGQHPSPHPSELTAPRHVPAPNVELGEEWDVPDLLPGELLIPSFHKICCSEDEDRDCEGMHYGCLTNRNHKIIGDVLFTVD